MIKNRSYYHYEVYRILVWNMLRLYIDPIIDSVNKSKIFDFEFKLEILLKLFKRVQLERLEKYPIKVLRVFEHLKSFLNNPIDSTNKDCIDNLNLFFKDTLFIELIKWVNNVADYIYNLVGMPGQVYNQIVDVLKETMPEKLNNIIEFKQITNE